MTDSRGQCLLPQRDRIYVKGKSPLLGLCCTGLPCSRAAGPTFLLPMWWLPHSGKVGEMSDLNSCPGVLLHLGYDKCEAVLNVRADYPAKAPFRMDEREVWQSTGAYKVLLQLK